MLVPKPLKVPKKKKVGKLTRLSTLGTAVDRLTRKANAMIAKERGKHQRKVQEINRQISSKLGLLSRAKKRETVVRLLRDVKSLRKELRDENAAYEKYVRSVERKLEALSEPRRYQIRKALETDIKFPNVYNEPAFTAKARQVLGNSRKNYSMIFLDIDKFGAFNKKFGQQVGDAVLRFFTEAFSEFCRKHGGFAGRLGGEELGGIVHGSSKKMAVKIQKEFVAMLNDKFTGSELSKTLPKMPTFSAGIAFSNRKVRGKKRTFAELKEAADRLMRRGKRSGRHTIFYERS